MHFVAQSNNLIDAFIWVGILCALIVVFWVAWAMIRKKYVAGSEAEEVAPWSLQDLRELKDRGELSDAEYDRLREQVIARHKSTQVDAK